MEVTLVNVLLVIGLLGVSSAEVPNVQLNDGTQMPILGLGTVEDDRNHTKTFHGVKYAVGEVGYRHLDTAHLYDNEEVIGRAVKELIDSGKVTRSDLFITTKVHNTNLAYDRALKSIRDSLKRLQTDYVDLILIHWPYALKQGDELFPKHANGSLMFGDTDYLETWTAFEEAVKLKLVKSIGVSNFNRRQLTRLLANAKIPPSVNQIESHPYLTQKPLIEFCQSNNIQVTAYSPLGRGDRNLLREPVIKQIGEKHSKTPAQVLIRYQIERGVIVIPKSSNATRIKENFEVFDFKLDEEDMREIEALNRDFRYIKHEKGKDHKEHPFKDPSDSSQTMLSMFYSMFLI